MTSADPLNRRWRRSTRWLRRFAVVLVAIGALVALTGWLRGQEQWGPFSGRLVDEETGTPIVDANVMVSWNRRLPTPTGDGGQTFLDAVESVTDAEGRFDLARRPRYWELFATRPGFSYFAPGYVASGREVNPPGGVPFVDSTVITMRPLKTMEDRCRQRPGSPLHGEVPLFLKAVRDYRLGLDC